MSMPRASIIACRVVLVITMIAIMLLATARQSFPIVEEINDKANHFLAFGETLTCGGQKHDGDHRDHQEIGRAHV